MLQFNYMALIIIADFQTYKDFTMNFIMPHSNIHNLFS